MSTPRLHSIPTSKRGRPRHINTVATRLIGFAGVEALRAEDLYIISGALARELALVIGEPAPSAPAIPLTSKETQD
jgi:hypothetical protein